MNVHILPLASSHFEGLRVALDIVARKKRYLAFTEAPPADEAYAFCRNILASGHSHFVALVDDEVSG